jgi:hypothetical protein
VAPSQGLSALKAALIQTQPEGMSGDDKNCNTPLMRITATQSRILAIRLRETTAPPATIQSPQLLNVIGEVASLSYFERTRHSLGCYAKMRAWAYLEPSHGEATLMSAPTLYLARMLHNLLVRPYERCGR